MNPLKTAILDLLKEQAGLNPEEIKPFIERPAQPASPAGRRERGDYALACFRMASQRHEPPPKFAADLAQRLKPSGLIQQINAEGGYVNFIADPLKYSQLIIRDIAGQKTEFGKSKEGAGKTIVIDFSSPNIAKPFGIAHLRSTVIGNALYKIYEALGYKCVGINYLGDWGTQFGHMIAGWKKWGKSELEPLNKYDVAKVTLEEAGKYYRLATSSQDINEQSNARKEFKRLEEGDKENLHLWNQFREMSLKEFQRIYDRLGVKFDEYQGERFYNQFVPPTVKELEQKGLTKISEGATIVDLEPYGLAPCLIKKSDEASLYATRDIAAAIYRYKMYHFAKILYVVGNDQKLHFQQVFKVLELMGHQWSKDCAHIGFGLIRFKGGKMSTRQGNVILLEDVLDEAIEKSRQMMRERAPELQLKVEATKTDEIARAAGIGAIIFNELKNKRTKDSEFDWDKILSFDGETGPYLQYTYVRLRSLARKYQETFKQSTEAITADELDYTLLNQPDEVALVKEMSFFPEIIQQTAHENEPSIISNYLLSLASLFNRYYRYHRIIDASNPVLSQSRITLVQCLRYILQHGLTLLGITVLEEM